MLVIFRFADKEVDLRNVLEDDQGIVIELLKGSGFRSTLLGTLDVHGGKVSTTPPITSYDVFINQQGEIQLCSRLEKP